MLPRALLHAGARLAGSGVAHSSRGVTCRVAARLSVATPQARLATHPATAPGSCRPSLRRLAAPPRTPSGACPAGAQSSKSNVHGSVEPPVSSSPPLQSRATCLVRSLITAARSLRNMTSAGTLLGRAASAAVHPASGGPRGAFIVFEGLDRSGKSTQCARVLGSLRDAGIPAEALRFPDRSTPVGQEIDEYLASTKDVDMETIHSLFSKNRWEKKEHMERLLSAGTTLIVDRYAFSGAAYSAAKGLNLQWCKTADAGLPAPDLVIYLNISPEAAATRGEYGAERYEKVDFQKLVAQQYMALKDATWQVIDASGAADDVFTQVWSGVQRAVKACQAPDAPCLGVLWAGSQGAQ